jgi:putative sterol carrier protein
VRSITVDLSKAKLSEGEAEKADVVFELDAATFVGLLDGTLRASDAFVGQKLKIRGNIVEAMKLEKALKKLHKK